jgi:hypothetical protein
MSGTLSPSVLTVFSGLQQGLALQKSSTVTGVIANLYTASSLTNSRPISGNTILASNLIASASSLSSFGNLIWAGSPTAFGLEISQINSHISTARSLKKSTNFISNTSFAEYGNGITNVGSLSTQGLDSHFGNLSAASKIMKTIGPAYDLTDIKNFGSSVGVVKKLNKAKLGNSSGVNAALAKNGIDLKNIEDPIYKDTVDKVLESITDKTVIASVVEQLGLNPISPLSNLLDLTDVRKFVSSSATGGLKVGLPDIASKFADMGASFKTPNDAESMLKNISTPSAPYLNTSTNLSTLTSSIASQISSAIGTGSDPEGLPTVTDFTEAISGGPNIALIAYHTDLITSNTAVGNVSYDIIRTTIANLISYSQGLFTKAGIDLTVTPTVGLSSRMSVASSLPQIGAQDARSNAANVLVSMTTSDQYGDAVKAALAEGRNKDLLIANGIKPFNFSG